MKIPRYTLYYWQHQPPKDHRDALAAAISYWDEHVFKPFNLNFDFINARYQPRYKNINYYQAVLYPLEKKLAEEIVAQRILGRPTQVQEKIHQYAAKEIPIQNNEAKEAQLLWLSDQFASGSEQTVLYHIDDSHEVCQQLPNKFSQLSSKNNVSVNTVFYEHAPLFANESCIELLTEIGLLNAMQQFMREEQGVDTGLVHPLHNLSVCLAVLQIPALESYVFSKIETVLKKINGALDLETLHLYHFVENVLITTKATGIVRRIIDNKAKVC